MYYAKSGFFDSLFLKPAYFAIILYMNRFLSISLFPLFLFFPFFSLAHGGVSKNVGSVVVYLNQTPISPLVGENVDMNFVIRDASNTPVSNLPVTLKLIDTFYGDQTRDKEILRQTITTDPNGSLDFTYTFKKQNYFDVELDFLDPQTHTPQNTGFLVQPRSAISYYWLVAAAIAGLGAGALIVKLRNKQK